MMMMADNIFLILQFKQTKWRQYITQIRPMWWLVSLEIKWDSDSFIHFEHFCFEQTNIGDGEKRVKASLINSIYIFTTFCCIVYGEVKRIIWNQTPKTKQKKCYLKIFPIKIKNFFHFINWKISFLFVCLFILFYPEKISKSIQEKTNIHIIRFSVEKGEKKIN